MNTEFSAEQKELIATIDNLLDRYKVPANARAVPWLRNEQLESDLAASGYLDLAVTEGYGLLDAMTLVEAVAKLPYSVEVGASAIVGPLLSSRLCGRRLALAEAPATGPIRYLAQAQAVLVATDRDVRLLDPSRCRIRDIETLFAYPVGVLESPDLADAEVVPGATPERMRVLWQLAIAAEACGLMQAAVDLTVQYLKDRRQFGRPIGSFQALQHRISECAAMVESARVLMQKAASTGEAADAAQAAFYAQDVAPRIVLDCQQMHGAMGCTLEYPLHFWTYRLKVLQADLGGIFRQAARGAAAFW